MARLSLDAIEPMESWQFVRSSVRAVRSDFDAEYRCRRAAEGKSPHEFVDAVTDGLVLGLERTLIVLKRAHAEPAAAEPPDRPERIGTQPEAL